MRPSAANVPIMKHTIQRAVASVLVPCMLLGSLPLQAQAGLISTEQVLVTSSADAQVSREKVTRVRAMSDAEVAALADRVDQAPAGGDVLGLLFAVFVILLVTDILGLTKVFPFTRSVR
jgi:hypothetical protein